MTSRVSNESYENLQNNLKDVERVHRRCDTAETRLNDRGISIVPYEQGQPSATLKGEPNP